MIRTRRSVVIERPIPEVFRYLARFESGMEWRSELRETRRVSAEPDGPGARYREIVDWDGRQATLVLEVTAFKPDERITYSIEGDAQGHGEYRLRAEDDGTHLSVSRDLELRQGLAAEEDAIHTALRRQGAQDLAHLKDILEHRWAWRAGTR